MVFVCYALNLLACELTYGEAYPTPFGERYTELYYMALAINHPMPLMGHYVAHTGAWIVRICLQPVADQKLCLGVCIIIWMLLFYDALFTVY